jgi:hypothetical protein
MGTFEFMFIEIFGIIVWGAVVNILLFYEVYYFLEPVVFPNMFGVWFILLKIDGWVGFCFYKIYISFDFY